VRSNGCDGAGVLVQGCFYLFERMLHGNALRRIGCGEQRLKGSDDGLRGELGLDELGDDSAPGDEVGHGDMRHADKALSDRVGKGREAIDDDKRVADECGLDGGGAAGDDAGASVTRCGRMADCDLVPD
jgi:hypothetical protein